MNTNTTAQSIQDYADRAAVLFNDALDNLQKIPGSSIVKRYIRSSYQDDPVRSAMELFLVLFAVYYLVSPTYSTKKEKHVPLTDEVSCGMRYGQADKTDDGGRKSMSSWRTGHLSL